MRSNFGIQLAAKWQFCNTTQWPFWTPSVISDWAYGPYDSRERRRCSFVFQRSLPVLDRGRPSWSSHRTRPSFRRILTEPSSDPHRVRERRSTVWPRWSQHRSPADRMWVARRIVVPSVWWCIAEQREPSYPVEIIVGGPVWSERRRSAMSLDGSSDAHLSRALTLLYSSG